ncbi:MAG TPA: hypothetical protein VGO52_19985 [Hyphomonadaceae bacterium]|nr:hypothetical protein [Hyphomonadaceae bacterium]
MDSKLKASDIGKRLAEAPGGSGAKFETDRFKRFVLAGIIPPSGTTRGRGGEAWLFPQSAVAIAHVLFWLYDNAGITAKPTLCQCWAFLGEPHHEDGEAAIDHVLAEIAAGRRPRLILTNWGCPRTGMTQLGMALRFEDELKRVIEPPIPGYQPLADLGLDLAHHLERFVFEKPPVGEVN